MAGCRALAGRLRRRLARAFWFALAVLFLVESWIWDHVKDWLRQLERALGLERLEAWLARLVDRLSPQMTLALFAVPMLSALPIKLAALMLLARGQVLPGRLFVFLAKSLTLGVEAFLFDICRDKLLQMGWFGRLYFIVLEIRAWATRLVWPFSLRAAAALAGLRAKIRAFMDSDGGRAYSQIAYPKQKSSSLSAGLIIDAALAKLAASKKAIAPKIAAFFIFSPPAPRVEIALSQFAPARLGLDQPDSVSPG